MPPKYANEISCSPTAFRPAASQPDGCGAFDRVKRLVRWIVYERILASSHEIFCVMSEKFHIPEFGRAGTIAHLPLLISDALAHDLDALTSRLASLRERPEALNQTSLRSRRNSRN